MAKKIVQLCYECNDYTEFEWVRDEDDIDESYYPRQEIFACTECGSEITFVSSRSA